MRIKMATIVKLLAILLLYLCAANGISANNDSRIDSAPITYDPSAGWIQIWSDEFSGTTINESHWHIDNFTYGRTEYGAKNFYIENGTLVIKATYNGKGFGPGNFNSSMLTTEGKRSFAYGKVAMRAKLPFGKGMFPAFWMLNRNNSGEIDIMEMIGGGNNDQIIYGTLHYKNSQGVDPAPEYKYTAPSPLSSDFHIYEVEWTPYGFTWKIDGIPYGAKLMDTDMEEFSKPFFILLNLQVGGNWPGNPDASTVFPQYYTIDWVRVYTSSLWNSLGG